MLPETTCWKKTHISAYVDVDKNQRDGQHINILKFKKTRLRIIHLVRTQNFPKNYHFLPPDKHTYVCISGGRKR